MTTWIKTAEAAKLADVTPVTIQSLCRKNVINFKVTKRRYLIDKESFEEYAKKAYIIQVRQNNIQDLNEKLRKETEKLEKKVKEVKQQMEDLKFYPERMRRLATFLRAELRMNIHSDIDNDTLRIMLDLLDTGTYKSISSKYDLTPERIRQIWQDGVAVYSRSMNKLKHLKERNEYLEQQYKRMLGELIKAKMIQNSPDVKWEKLNDETISDMLEPLNKNELGLRLYNTLTDNGISNLGELASQSYNDIARMKWVGVSFMKKIEKYLSDRGMKLGMTLPEFNNK